MRSLLLFAAPLVLLTACASAGPSLETERAEVQDSGYSPYGLYLAGEAALNDGQNREAARLFDMARGDPAASQLLSERAFQAALLAGDVQKAATIAPSGDDASEAGKRLGALVVAVESMAQGKGKAAQVQLASEDLGFPHKSAAVLLAPWAAAMAGDAEGALVRPEVKGDRLVEYFGQLGRGQLFERARRYDEAETEFKAATTGDRPSVISLVAYGAFLERRGRRADAVALYDRGLAADPSSSELLIARARAAAGKSAPELPTLKAGAAQALLGPAATMMAARQGQIALAYLRLALRLDPTRDDAWVMTGDALQASGDTEAARLAYAKPKPGSAYYATGQAKLAWTYQQAEEPESAIRIARAAAVGGGAEARLTLADLLRANERYPEAAELLTGLINEAKTPDWRILYARAVVYERMGRWPDAEKDLRTALEAEPDEAELLNFLGYSWIDRGERLPEALKMVEQAVAQNPRSGPMVDSLGWAYFKLGDYKRAVEKLEQAVELEAGDPEINNHLGDAYWKVGRRDEAVFQWRRVLTLDPDAKIRAEVEGKLASGAGPGGKPARIAGQ
ncbi:tetratricopeptide repeat protein [Phenylobacterium deserti]|uniref:Tetratricopeptide repeat protein n=1 Tax=Phenylobacterium deserti TaxID=1914756 RepID=A0A328ADK9_9CAUL|nr:tetratricopeptide repeat protein [Phenylobacterium deserti]RAK52306.1 hypothetical protein DJ018_14290 [Phenylobacterium deserti]